MSINLEDLGLTQEELQTRVVDQICKKVLATTYGDEDGVDYEKESLLAKALVKKVEKASQEKIAALFAAHVAPRVNEYIETLVLQKTNEWGEKRGEPISFIEYLLKAANDYMTEQVSSDGKSKSESQGSYGWSGKQSRVSYMIDKHLHYSIETAMKKALTTANSAIVTGLEATVKLKLEEIVKSLAVNVKI